jgi:hypothetical protein
LEVQGSEHFAYSFNFAHNLCGLPCQLVLNKSSIANGYTPNRDAVANHRAIVVSCYSKRKGGWSGRLDRFRSSGAVAFALGFLQVQADFGDHLAEALNCRENNFWRAHGVSIVHDESRDSTTLTQLGVERLDVRVNPSAESSASGAIPLLHPFFRVEAGSLQALGSKENLAPHCVSGPEQRDQAT